MRFFSALKTPKGAYKSGFLALEAIKNRKSGRLLSRGGIVYMAENEKYFLETLNKAFCLDRTIFDERGAWDIGDGQGPFFEQEQHFPYCDHLGTLGLPGENRGFAIQIGGPVRLFRYLGS
jgi:hypothetical protein